jgi:hypothetical protein
VGTLDIEDSTTFPLALSFSLSDLRDLKTSGARAKQFTIPASKNNNAVLGKIHNFNVNPDSFIIADCAVFVNGLPVLSGQINIKGTLVDKQPANYTAEILGDNSEWIALMKDISLRDLEFGNPALTANRPSDGSSVSVSAGGTVTYDRDSVELSWQAFQDDVNWDYVYAPVGLGDWWKFKYCKN